MATSQIDHQTIARASGNADHHEIVALSFLAAQNAVTMLDGAAQNAGFTGPADTIPAIMIGCQTSREKRVEQGLALGHGDDPSTPCQFDGVGSGPVILRSAGSEAFDMAMSDSDCSASSLKRSQHCGRPATIGVHIRSIAGAVPGKKSFQGRRSSVLFVVEMEKKVSPERLSSAKNAACERLFAL